MTSKKANRNDPCPCGSGKKYKKCCINKMGTKKFQAKLLSQTLGGNDTGALSNKLTGMLQNISKMNKNLEDLEKDLKIPTERHFTKDVQ